MNSVASMIMPASKCVPSSSWESITVSLFTPSFRITRLRVGWPGWADDFVSAASAEQAGACWHVQSPWYSSLQPSFWAGLVCGRISSPAAVRPALPPTSSLWLTTAACLEHAASYLTQYLEYQFAATQFLAIQQLAQIATRQPSARQK